ncbi:hypothetical protein DCC81_13540 [Chitinophaga parva]|uniref:FecR protein domain-containing protein n=1 Tax=Chitinophaga parva TaxID=2169414 RepID=A0A2T7BGG4_9BACT|nr:FecR family protein [Chitinophaga parva]PUZ25323.1 hypothetical protein DCC81_13540 [Chitinophaga parva]
MLSTAEIEKLLQSLQEATSPQEKQRILDLLSAHESALLQHLETEFQSATGMPAADPAQQAATYQQLLERTGQHPAIRMVPHRNWKRTIRVAAAVLLIGGGSLGLWKLLDYRHTNNMVAKAPVYAPAAMDTLFNQESHVVNQLFPDGSEVALEPGSYVSYQRDFIHNKKVYLEGAATFTVKNDPVHPFSVVAGPLEVRDLGTIFYIHDQPGTVNVKLLKGKVLIHSLKAHPGTLHDDVVMQPGQLFSMDKLHETFVITELEKATKPAGPQPARKASYNLDFQNASLASVFKTLEGRFGKKIIYKSDAINDKLFTGNLANQPNIEHAIKLICISNNLQFEIQGDAIIIH